MGFIDYAWTVSLQKDNTKVKILQDATISQPLLLADNFGFTIKLPIVKTLDDGRFSYLDHKFPANNIGKTKIGRLFRAAVLHLTAQTLAPYSKEKIAPRETDAISEAFAKSLINDTYTNIYIQEKHPEMFFDIAFANALAYQKIKPSDRIFTIQEGILHKLPDFVLSLFRVFAVKNTN